MEEENYIDFVKEKIELEKLLSVTKPEYHNEIIKLLNKKKQIIKKNGFLANFQLNKINNKIEKLKRM